MRMCGIHFVKEKLLKLFLVCLLESSVDNSKKLEGKDTPSNLKSRTIT